MKTMCILSMCKSHGGPVSLLDLDESLNNLDEKQLLLEVAYLHAPLQLTFIKSNV